jgi:hypothetical protein
MNSIKNIKFYKPVPFKKRAIDFFKGLIFWRGRKKGMIHTMDIEWDHIRAVFFPKNFSEKYRYLGPWLSSNEKSDYFKALYPLVLAMDYEAKPKWCPRWFLRFLHLFGSDNSIVRVRNFTLYNLEKKLTKGILFVDWKTKWTDYDLRISIYAPEHLQDLSDAIEDNFYEKGKRKELIERIKKITPEEKILDTTISSLEKKLEEMEKKLDEERG